MAVSPTRWLSDLDPDRRKLVRALRRQVEVHSAPDACAVKWGALCYFKGERAYVGLASHARHVAVILDRGAELTDPEGVLEGKGRIRRQIVIREPAQIELKRVGDYVARCFELE